MADAATLFRSEYETEMEGWLRTRFRWLCYLYIVYEAIALIVNFFQLGLVAHWSVLIPIVAAASKLGIVIGFLYLGRWEHATREQALRAATWMILLLGGATLLTDFILHGFQAKPLGSIFLWHITACLFLPWTPRESLRPIVPLLAAWALVSMWYIFRTAEWLSLLTIVGSPLVLAPGWFICAWRLHRHGQHFHSRMIGKHFWSMRRELQRARSIHESMFPEPRASETVQFDYAYSPATDIGGDYVHLHVSDEGRWHLTLIDVTGHGLVAALTVNRLFGELERIRAESPNAEPGEVLTLLNRYFYLTLQRHNIYATAIAITIDPEAETAMWCNAGHPPAYVRGVNGVIHELHATETLLGALEPDEFEPDQQTLHLAPGDVLITYTDGAFEATNSSDEQFGLPRLRGILSSSQPTATSRFTWSRHVATAVEKHARGRVSDDVLVACLRFDGKPVRSPDEYARAAGEVRG